MTVHLKLPDAGAELIRRHAEQWERDHTISRMWDKDPTVWADPSVPEIADRLGWLDAPTASFDLLDQIDELRTSAISDGVTDLVLCGMGGSSLAPEVFATSLGPEAIPKLTVMDSTHPDAVRAVASSVDPATTWFIVASKSGGTIETMSFFHYFWDLTAATVDTPGDHFIAITDPDTSLGELAAERQFRATVLADPNVGGRYSALTAFGLVPAGIIGADIRSLLRSAAEAALACGPATPLVENPGFALGAFLADHAISGTDKVQFIGSAPVDAIGIWVEQLIAESTGKLGVGIVPIDGGPIIEGSPAATVVGVGHDPSPVADVSLKVEESHDLAGVMFILEFATAVAGAVLGINPFDQPDVQLAKKLAKDAMDGSSDASTQPPLDVTDSGWAQEFADAISDNELSYVSVQAYVPQNRETGLLLESLRADLTESSGAYVTVGYGPRFLHSTGQLHKGGPAGGVFLQISGDTGAEMEVPEAGYTFNELITAQAAGDRAALVDRDRTVFAVDIGPNAVRGLTDLTSQLKSALSPAD